MYIYNCIYIYIVYKFGTNYIYRMFLLLRSIYEETDYLMKSISKIERVFLVESI